MANQETELASQGAAEAGEVSFLEQAIAATKQTARDEAQDLLKTLTEQAMKGTSCSIGFWVAITRNRSGKR